MKVIHFKVFIFLFFTIQTGYAAVFKGRVIDSETGEYLTGATIVDVTDKTIFSISGLDGTFIIKNLGAVTYQFEIRYIGYEKQTIPVTFRGNDEIKNIKIKLNPVSTTLEGISVVGSYDKESNMYARQREKTSENVLNVISARTIQLLPDNTTASVLQRMSGVSVERTSSGEARYAIIRGMDKRYNYTLVNGIKIPSPDNNYRYVPMDMFPSNLLDRLEVIKALTPAMEGDAIGGAMNLVMKDAPDVLTITANAGSGFSELLTERKYSNFNKSVVSNKSPADIHGPAYVATPYDFTYKNFDYKTQKLPFNEHLSFSIGNRFLKGNKLGIIVAGNYQNEYKGSDRIWFKPNNQPEPGNVPSFEDYYSRQYNKQSTRYGLHSKIDYAFNAKNKISFYNLYLKMIDVEYRATIDTSLSIGRDGVGTGNTYLKYRSKLQNQSIYNSTLQGEHTVTHNFNINWSAVYSLATNDLPDWSEYQTVQEVGFDINHNQTATPQVLNIPFYRIWTRNSDSDYSGYLNLTYHKQIAGQDVTIAAGGMYRDRSRDNHYNEWDLVPKTSSTGDRVPFDGQLTPDKFQFNGTTAAQGSPVNPLTYSASEKIAAYYVQATVLIHQKFSVLGGARVENTEQGWKTAQDPKIAPGAQGTVTYQDILPSVHLKYTLNNKQDLRLSWFSGINRPGFFEYVPYLIRGDNFDMSGNPNLLHTTSNNFDLRYEYFPTLIDQILLGAFYKKLINPIETGIRFTGTSSATLWPVNADNAQNYGFELAVARFWGHVGISGNYTYTHSRVIRPKLYYNTDFVAENTTEKGPLGGQSPHVGNVSLLFKNPKAGINAQLALVYTGKNITLISPYKGLDYWQRGTSQLGFSFEKRILKYLTLYCKINNILNTPILVEIHQPNVYKTGKFALPFQTRDDRVIVQKDTYGQSFTFGIRFNNLMRNN